MLSSTQHKVELSKWLRLIHEVFVGEGKKIRFTLYDGSDENRSPHFISGALNARYLIIAFTGRCGRRWTKVPAASAHSIVICFQALASSAVSFPTGSQYPH